MIDFHNQVVLITGAARGLGFAYARCLAQLGATVVIHDIGADSDGHGIDKHIAERAAHELQREGLNVQAINGNIESRAGCHQLCDDVRRLCGRLDVLIHNAGWVAYAPIDSVTEAAFEHMMTVSTKAALWLAQAAWPTMKAAGYGRIILTTSCRALYPQYVQEGLAAYAAAKMAVVGLVNTLAAEGKKDGIIVNAISPVAKTRMWGINGTPDDLCPAAVAIGVAYLAARDCTDGGWILRAANGQFHATKAVEATGVDYPYDLNATPASTVQEISEKWAHIAISNVEPRSSML